MVMGLYEGMSRSSDSFPMYIPYVDGLPQCLRRPIFDLLEATPETNARGQVLLKPVFERIKKTILNRDYGAEGYMNYARNPEIAANRCLAVKTLINLCEYFCLVIVHYRMFCVYRRFHSCVTMMAHDRFLRRSDLSKIPVLL